MTGDVIFMPDDVELRTLHELMGNSLSALVKANAIVDD